jgi:hypothetical protein
MVSVSLVIIFSLHAHGSQDVSGHSNVNFVTSFGGRYGVYSNLQESLLIYKQILVYIIK